MLPFFYQESGVIIFNFIISPGPCLLWFQLQVTAQALSECNFHSSLHYQFQMDSFSKQEKKNPITSKDSIINSQLYVLMGHKGNTKYIKYKKSIRFISGTISMYSTTKSI